MRINKYIAETTGMSRRTADTVIAAGRITANGQQITPGYAVAPGDSITMDGQTLTPQVTKTTIMLNKPTGFVCSRRGQGSRTVYDLLPISLHHLKPVGRLDKNSSGLLLLTNDGDLAHQLTHPKHAKIKQYTVRLNKPLAQQDFTSITKQGVPLADGASRLRLDYINDQNRDWTVSMSEGRNRQIRRTFEHLGYRVASLHRTHFGPYHLDGLKVGKYTAA